MILGSGGIGMVLESEAGARRRHAAAIVAHHRNSSSLTSASVDLPTSLAPFKCRLLGTLLSNSAYHGAAMDRAHIASEMERFIASMEVEHGIRRSDIAHQGVYFSHETGTHASPSSSCAANEVLLYSFGIYFQIFHEDNLFDSMILISFLILLLCTDLWITSSLWQASVGFIDFEYQRIYRPSNGSIF